MASGLITGSVDKTARVWDLENAGAAIQPLESLSGNQTSHMARFSSRWAIHRRPPTSAAKASVCGMPPRANCVRELSSRRQGTRPQRRVSRPTDNRLLAVGYGGQADISYVSLWDIDAGTELARLPGATDLPELSGLDENGSAVGALAFSPDGKHLVAGFGSKKLLRPVQSSPVH